MKKYISLFLILIMIFSFSACGWKVEIVNPNEGIIESESEIKQEQGEIDKDEYYNEVLEVPENPVKDEENSAVSENFEFSEETKEISVITPAYYPKEITLTVPENTVLNGEGDNLTAVFSDGSSLTAGWIFVHELEETTRYDDTLYYYRNPEESLGYIFHERVICKKYDCLRIICHSGGGDKNSPEVPEEEKFYNYQYFFEISPSEVLSLDFYAKGPENTEAMKLQEKIIANLSAKDPESYIETENGKLSGMIHPTVLYSPEQEKVFENELVAVSMSVPEGWEQGTLEEEGEIYGITFTMPWDERFETYLFVYKDDGTTFDHYYNEYSWNLKINDHTFNEVSGNFSKGVYIRADGPAKNLGDSENWFRTSTWFYVLQFDGYVAVLHQNVRLDENGIPFAEHEKACNDFASSIKIG